MDSIKTNQTQKMNGLERGWHENGQLLFRMFFKEGVRNGIEEKWNKKMRT